MTMKLLSDYHKEAEIVFNNSTLASWDYQTNITEETRKVQVCFVHVLKKVLYLHYSATAATATATSTGGGD